MVRGALVRVDVDWSRQVVVADASLRTLGELPKFVVLDSGPQLVGGVGFVGVVGRLCELVPARVRQPAGLRPVGWFRSAMEWLDRALALALRWPRLLRESVRGGRTPLRFPHALCPARAGADRTPALAPGQHLHAHRRLSARPFVGRTKRTCKRPPIRNRPASCDLAVVRRRRSSPRLSDRRAWFGVARSGRAAAGVSDRGARGLVFDRAGATLSSRRVSLPDGLAGCAALSGSRRRESRRPALLDTPCTGGSLSSSRKREPGSSALLDTSGTGGLGAFRSSGTLSGGVAWISLSAERGGVASRRRPAGGDTRIATSTARGQAGGEQRAAPKRNGSRTWRRWRWQSARAHAAATVEYEERAGCFVASAR